MEGVRVEAIGGRTLIEKNMVFDEKLLIGDKPIKQIVISMDWTCGSYGGYIPVFTNATIEVEGKEVYNWGKDFECHIVDGRDWYPEPEPAPFRLSKWEGRIRTTKLPENVKALLNKMLNEIPEPDDDYAYPISVLYIFLK